MKRCANCGRHISRREWSTLPLVGYFCLPADDDGPEEHREYRNCACRSTLIVRVGPTHSGPCEIRPTRRDPSTMTLFHGTRESGRILTEGFVPSSGGEFGPGIYFTDYPHTARFYAEHVARGSGPPTVLATRVRVSRPFVIRKLDWLKLVTRRTPRSVRRRLEREGYDAIIGIGLNDIDKQVVLFDPASVVDGSVRILRREDMPR
jgi:hypothetical protein